MKIINFGSLNLDYVYKVDKIVSPGETISSEGYSVFCGGKGLNQSIALRKAANANIQVCHAGAIGKDGAALRKALEENGVDTSMLQEVDGPSGHAIIQVDKKGRNSIIVHGGANKSLSFGLIQMAVSSLEPGDIALAQNETNLTAEIARLCAKQGVHFALNPSPMDDVISKTFPFELVRWLLINEIEGQALSGESEPRKIAEVLSNRYPECEIVLTLGEDGVLYKSKVQEMSVSACKVDAVDTTAAGDTFAGFFLGSVAEGDILPKSLPLASAAAAIAVSRMGASASIPTRDEAEKLWQSVYLAKG
ncbi:MAG: ribokinase [Clostridiales bacterium]|jgi:ribokinase|nr:ribokinase [Clostridiales bacterium]